MLRHSTQYIYLIAFTKRRPSKEDRLMPNLLGKDVLQSEIEAEEKRVENKGPASAKSQETGQERSGVQMAGRPEFSILDQILYRGLNAVIILFTASMMLLPMSTNVALAVAKKCSAASTPDCTLCPRLLKKLVTREAKPK